MEIDSPPSIKHHLKDPTCDFLDVRVKEHNTHEDDDIHEDEVHGPNHKPLDQINLQEEINHMTRRRSGLGRLV